MKKAFLIVAAALALTSVSCSNRTPKLQDHNDSLNWVLGQSFALGLKSTSLPLDKDMVLAAVAATLDGKEQPIDNETYNLLLTELNTRISASQNQKMQQDLESIAAAEQAYFEKLVAENPNLKRADEGFYYEVLQHGKGKKATRADIVKFDFRSLFTNGQVYEQTYGNREPVTTTVGNPMFPGLQAAFTYMNAGSKYRFYFPSQLAFGAQGADGIPPYSIMIYEIELHSIN